MKPICYIQIHVIDGFYAQDGNGCEYEGYVPKEFSDCDEDYDDDMFIDIYPDGSTSLTKEKMLSFVERLRSGEI